MDIVDAGISKHTSFLASEFTGVRGWLVLTSDEAGKAAKEM